MTSYLQKLMLRFSGWCGLKAMIVDWPAGLPGDIGFILT
jgi:hypothetical protein